MPENGETRKEGDMWLLAFRFHDMKTAGEAYELARDLVFGLDIEASAFRIQVAGIPHVAVLGDAPLMPPVRDMFERSCSKGKPVELTEEVTEALFSRRAEGKIPGVFWERRSL